jgi:ABC-type uncharacterized transport system ATPase component
MDSVETKLTERRYLWLRQDTCQSIDVLSKGSRRVAASIMRAGIEAEVARLQAIAPALDPVTAQLVASAQARGLDVRQVLTNALEANLQDSAQQTAA